MSKYISNQKFINEALKVIDPVLCYMLLSTFTNENDLDMGRQDKLKFNGQLDIVKNHRE